MSLRQPENHQSNLEQWVREVLDRSAGSVEAAPIVVKVLKSPSTVEVKKPSRRAAGMGWRAVVAAAALAAILCIVPLSTEQASAKTLVEQALQASRPIDRCYVIETEWKSKSKMDLLLKLPDKSLLWTRGDRFMVEIPIKQSGSNAADAKQVVRFGRDEKGRIWFVLSPQLGVRFEPEELKAVGDKLNGFWEHYSMNDEMLLRDLLANFKLKRPRDERRGGRRLQVVEAVPNSTDSDSPVTKARLELDYQNKTLRRVTLHQRATTITFTLRESISQAQTDSHYQVETYLNAEGYQSLQDQGPVLFRAFRLINAMRKYD